MILKQIHDLPIKNNDVYILETCKNNIIINDNCRGLLALNTSLNIIATIPIENSPEIYSIYTQYDYSKVMLYCPEDQRMIFINLHTLYSHIIAIPQNIEQQIFSPNYYWHENTFILTTFSDLFYQYAFASNSLKQITKETVKAVTPVFFNFWKEYKSHTIINTYPHQNAFIFQQSPNTISFFDGSNNQTTSVHNFSGGWHDIEYNDGIFIFIHEDTIEIIQNKNKIILQPEPSYYFQKVRFINKNTIVILSSSHSETLQSTIKIYKII